MSGTVGGRGGLFLEASPGFEPPGESVASTRGHRLSGYWRVDVCCVIAAVALVEGSVMNQPSSVIVTDEVVHSCGGVTDAR